MTSCIRDIDRLNLDTNCPLLDPREHADIVDAFNDIISCFEHVHEIHDWIQVYLEPDKNDPEIGVSPKQLGLCERVLQLRSQLSRRKYKVGFTGRSQVGKTSSVNEVLGYDILAEGKGVACTSVVTIIDISASQCRPSFVATYFTYDEFRRRFEGIAAQKGLSGCPVKELPQSVTHIKNTIDELRKWQKTVTTEFQGDVAFLIAALEQFSIGHKLLGSRTLEFNCQNESELEQRLAELVTYRPAGSAQSISDVECPLLIKDVRVTIHLPSISPTIELIDLPGLGTIREYDSTLTSSYVRDLDGLLLFVLPTSMDPKECQTLVQNLRKTHEDTEGRLWLIVSRMDSADSDLLRNGRFFDSLKSDSLQAFNLKPEQARFLSIYCEVREKGEGKKIRTSMVTDPEQRATALKLSFKDGEIRLPDVLINGNHAAFQTAFAEYASDGGIASFRRVIESQVASTVRDATCRDVRKKLLNLIEDIRTCLLSAQEGGLNEQNRSLLVDWASVFQEVESRLAPGRMREELNRIYGPLFESLRLEIDTKLTDQFMDVTQQAHQRIQRVKPGAGTGQTSTDLEPGEDDPWVHLHENLTSPMKVTCKNQIIPLTRQHAQAVVAVLMELAKKKPRLKSENNSLQSPNGFEPISRFLQQVESEIIGKDYFDEDLESLAAPTPLVNPLNPKKVRDIRPAEYKVVMNRKSETLCYRLVSKNRVQLINECRRIHRQLTLRAKSTDGPNVIAPELLKSGLECLRLAAAKLSKTRDLVETKQN